MTTRPALRFRRLLAFIIDILIFSCPTFLIFSAVFSPDIWQALLGEATVLSTKLLYGLAGWGTLFVVFGAFQGAFKNTPGKWLLGLRYLFLKGSGHYSLRLFLRSLIQLLAFPINAAMLLWGKRTVADALGGTLVSVRQLRRRDFIFAFIAIYLIQIVNSLILSKNGAYQAHTKAFSEIITQQLLSKPEGVAGLKEIQRLFPDQKITLASAKTQRDLATIGFFVEGKKQIIQVVREGSEWHAQHIQTCSSVGMVEYCQNTSSKP